MTESPAVPVGLNRSLRAAFEARATQLKAEVIPVSLGDLVPALQEAIGDISGGVGLGTAARALLPELATLARDVEGWPRVAITRAMLGIATTGSVVLAETVHRDRLLGLLSTRHIVLLPAEALVESLEDATPLLRRWFVGGARRYVTYVSGPSRTSDIERALTVGVHGPHEFVVMMVEGWEPPDD